jgi:hypothetical protein
VPGIHVIFFVASPESGSNCGAHGIAEHFAAVELVEARDLALLRRGLNLSARQVGLPRVINNLLSRLSTRHVILLQIGPYDVSVGREIVERAA